MRTFSLSHSEVIQDGEGKLEGGSPEKREKKLHLFFGLALRFSGKPG